MRRSRALLDPREPPTVSSRQFDAAGGSVHPSSSSESRVLAEMSVRCAFTVKPAMTTASEQQKKQRGPLMQCNIEQLSFWKTNADPGTPVIVSLIADNFSLLDRRLGPACAWPAC